MRRRRRAKKTNPSSLLILAIVAIGAVGFVFRKQIHDRLFGPAVKPGDNGPGPLPPENIPLMPVPPDLR